MLPNNVKAQTERGNLAAKKCIQLHIVSFWNLQIKISSLIYC